MKKFLCLLSVFVVAGTSAAMAGCSSGKSEGSLGLSYGKEYIYSYYDRWHEIERSVVFDKNGTGKYREKQTAKQDDFDNWNYTVSFRYLYYAEEDTVFCFYDSVEYGEEPEDADEIIESDWGMKFLCTKELLQATNGAVFVNEEYLPNIPNYNRPSEE